MNRRSFLGSLLAAPIAAVMGLKQKGPIGWWGRETFKRHRHKAVGHTLTVHPKHEETVRAIMDGMPETKPFVEESWRKLGESFGNSYNFVKSREASEIMARIDRREKRKWRRS